VTVKKDVRSRKATQLSAQYPTTWTTCRIPRPTER